MKIQQIIDIINLEGGRATVDDICNVIRDKWSMYIDDSFKSNIQNILSAHPESFKYNDLLKKWEARPDNEAKTNYLYVDDSRTFRTIREVMQNIFGYQKVQSQCGHFKLGDDTYVWFPQNKNKNWINTYTEDHRHWEEEPVDKDKRQGGLPSGNRYVFVKTKDINNRPVYKFTGKFQAISCDKNGKVIYEIVDDKVPLCYAVTRRMILCNVSNDNASMNSNVAFDQKTNSPSNYNQNFEKAFFSVKSDSKVRGNINTLSNEEYEEAKKIVLENIDHGYAGKEQIDNVRVVFVSNHVENTGFAVIGWYDNAVVYRDRQSTDGSAYNLECSCDTAHCIPVDKRTFICTVNDDQAQKFGNSTILYPLLFTEPSLKELVKSINNYLDGLNTTNL